MMKGPEMTRLPRLLTALALLALPAGIAHAQKAAPPCAAEAARDAESLLKFHATEGGKDPEMASDVAPVDIGDVVDAGGLKPLKGHSSRYKVLEVIGHVYRTDYRIHVIYAEMPDQCMLVGQEILVIDGDF